MWRALGLTSGDLHDNWKNVPGCSQLDCSLPGCYSPDSVPTADCSSLDYGLSDSSDPGSLVDFYCRSYHDGSCLNLKLFPGILISSTQFQKKKKKRDKPFCDQPP